MSKEIMKKVRALEKKIGLDIYNDIMDIIWKLELKVDDLTKSRDKWRSKFFELQLENEELKRELK